MENTENDVKVYFVTIPAHKYLHIRNYESVGYWDFWQKQSQVPGQDCETICGLLDRIKGKLDDMGGTDANSGSGQIMAYINEPAGRIIMTMPRPVIALTPRRAGCSIFIMIPNGFGNVSGR